MSEEKPICGICGATVPECGSFVQCRIFPTRFVCTKCCTQCLHFREQGSLIYCAASDSEKK